MLAKLVIINTKHQFNIFASELSNALIASEKSIQNKERNKILPDEIHEIFKNIAKRNQEKPQVEQSILMTIL